MVGQDLAFGAALLGLAGLALAGSPAETVGSSVPRASLCKNVVATCSSSMEKFESQQCVGRQQVKGISAAKQKITLYPFTSRSGLTRSCSRLQLREHFLKCKLYFGHLFPCRGRCGTLVGAGYPPPVISHTGCRGALSLTGSSNSGSLSSSYLMEATEFILKHKLGHRVPPGDSAGNK